MDRKIQYLTYLLLLNFRIIEVARISENENLKPIYMFLRIGFFFCETIWEFEPTLESFKKKCCSSILPRLSNDNLNKVTRVLHAVKRKLVVLDNFTPETRFTVLKTMVQVEWICK